MSLRNPFWSGWLLVPAMATFAADSIAPSSETPERDMVLWYRQPAGKWLEAMPLGNGRIGAMAFGGIEKERIALNESSFWSGRPHDNNDPEANIYFPQIRDLVFAGKYQEAEKMADEHFYGKPAAQQAYQPLGDLLLSFDGAENAADYRRAWGMETGVAKITFRTARATECKVQYGGRTVEISFKPGQSIRLNTELAVIN